MRKIFIALIGLGLLSACTPADEQYCESYGVAGTPEFGKCISYYHQQQQLFDGDYAQCSAIADVTYPQTLYDQGGYVPVMVGPGWNGFPYRDYAYVQPDYRKNSQVDQLRLRIIGPCMTDKGWNSPLTWQAGKRTVSQSSNRKTVTVKPDIQNGLPWLH